MRDIKRIVLHCSATIEGKEYSVDTIRKWHTNKGWSATATTKIGGGSITAGPVTLTP